MRCFWFLSASLLQCLVAAKDLTLLVRRIDGSGDYNLTCVAGAASSKFAMLWLPSDSVEEEVVAGSRYLGENYIDKFDSSHFLNGYFKGTVDRSLVHNLPAVLDKRWEDFEFINKFTLENNLYHNCFDSYKGNATVINFSVFLGQEDIILELRTATGKLCVAIRTDNTYKSAFSSCEIIADFHRFSDEEDEQEQIKSWRHFTVFKQDGEFALVTTDPTMGSAGHEEFDLEGVVVITEAANDWKMHDYRFLRIDEESNTRIFVEHIRRLFGQDYTCISFFLFMEGTCEVTISLCDKTCRLVYAAKTFSKGGFWAEERLYVNPPQTPDKVFMFAKKSPECRFAAIDDVRHCGVNETRILNLQTSNIEVGCQSLMDGNSTLRYKKPLSSVKTNVSFSEEKQVVCYGDHCYCSNGLKGDWCDEDPAVTIGIKLVEATSVVGLFETESHYSHLELELNEVKLNKVTVDGSTYNYRFLNLMPGTTYQVRARFCSSASCTPHGHANFTTRLCKVITRDQLTVTNSTTWVRLELSSLDFSFCPASFFEVTIDGQAQTLYNETTYTNLLPFKAYEIRVNIKSQFLRYTVFSLQRIKNYGFVTSARTEYSVPDKLENVTTKSISPTELEITFYPSLGKKIIHEYRATYTKIYNACGPIANADAKNVSSAKDNIILNDLDPYSTYKLSVMAVNDKGPGQAHDCTFDTVGLETTTEEEKLVNISGNHLIIPDCGTLRGPLVYRLTGTCLEDWCTEPSNQLVFEFRESGLFSEFLSRLPAHARHTVDIEVGRSASGNFSFRTFNIVSPPGKPNQVQDLKVYSKDERSISLKWKPPFPPTGVPEKYSVDVCRFQVCRIVENITNCSLWDGYFCSNIEDLAEHITYNITVYAKNKDISDLSQRGVFAKTEQTASEPPTNLTLIALEHCEFELQWSHPDITNGPLKYFLVTITDPGTSLVSTQELEVEHYEKKYSLQLIQLQSRTSYEVYVEAFNLLHRSSPSEIAKFSTCYPVTKTAWISISLAVIVVVILAVVVFIMIRQRNKNKWSGYTPSGLGGLRRTSSDQGAIIDRRMFPMEIASTIEFNAYDRMVQDEYVRIEDIQVQMDDVVYIDGWKGEKTYICTKSPNSSMMDSFWPLIWNENVSRIIGFMTRSENLLPANIYWPENTYKSESMPRITVRNISTQTFADFTVIYFTIFKTDEQERRVQQITFTSYPADNIPTSPFSFINFLNYVKSGDNKDLKMLVHCSDGSNRSGAFMMCYNFMHTRTDTVHMKKNLLDMRKCHPLLLSECIQYKFVYFVINEYISARKTEVNINEFLYHYESMCLKKLTEEFDYVQRRDYVWKMLRNATPETEDDINTVSVYGYQGQITYWTTSGVGGNDVSKFWNFVKTRGIKVVIFLQDMGESIKDIWPTNSKTPLTFNESQIRITMSGHHRQNNMNTYRLTMESNAELSQVLLLYYRGWNFGKSIPENSAEFYNLYNYLTTIENGNEVLVSCRNGYSACGLLICFDLVFQRLKFENVFDLCWAVQTIRYRNKFFMNELEQHQFIYSVIFDYLDDIQNNHGNGYSTTKDHYLVPNTMPTTSSNRGNSSTDKSKTTPLEPKYSLLRFNRPPRREYSPEALRLFDAESDEDSDATLYGNA